MGNRHIMSNRHFTGGSLASNLDRKGATIMNNAHLPSGMTGRTGGYDIIGNANGRIRRAMMIGAIEASKKDLTPAEHKKVADLMDQRIEKVLSPVYRPCYTLAVTTHSRDKYETCAVKLLLAIAGDKGVSQLVSSVAEVEKEFGDLVTLQRAMVTRLTECNDYMSQGWFKRLFGSKK